MRGRSVKKKQNNGRAYTTKIEVKEHHFDNCFELDTNAKSRFVRLSFEKFPVVYMTMYQKESDKKVYFGNFFFHRWEIEKIEKILIAISKIELSIEKII